MALFRKLLRRAFYAAAAVSTLLLLATLIVWPVSHYRRVHAAYDGSARYYLGADSGRAYFGYQRVFGYSSGWQFGASDLNLSNWRYLTWNAPETEWEITGATFLGVRWDPSLPGAEWTYRLVYIPFSYLVLVFSILPLLAFRSIRRRRRVARVGLCAKCGYDLRAHGPGDKCPECGTLVAPSTRRTSSSSSLSSSGDED